jgi:hypothetical protein
VKNKYLMEYSVKIFPFSWKQWSIFKKFIMFEFHNILFT